MEDNKLNDSQDKPTALVSDELQFFSFLQMASNLRQILKAELSLIGLAAFSGKFHAVCKI